MNVIEQIKKDREGKDSGEVKVSTDLGKRSRNNVVFLSMLFLIILFVIIMSVVNKRGTEEETVTPPDVQIEVSEEALVEITADGFVPQTLSVPVNTQVTFTNTDNELHSVSSDPYPSNDNYPEFNSTDNIPPNSSYSFLFDTPGTYTYHDDIKPFDFQGTIVVSD